MNQKGKTLEIDLNQSKKTPSLFAWLASGMTNLVIILTHILPRGDYPILRGSGVMLLLFAGIFIFTPFYTLSKRGESRGDQSNMQSRKVVDQGLFAITRHP